MTWIAMPLKTKANDATRRSATTSRTETCPPSRARAAGGSRRLLMSIWHACVDAVWPGRLPADVLSRKKQRERELVVLAAAKNEFEATLADMLTVEVNLLQAKVQAARSLQELWHLRVGVFGAVSCHHSQDEAEYRLARLNRHFPTRSARSGFAPLDDAS